MIALPAGPLLFDTGIPATSTGPPRIQGFFLFGAPESVMTVALPHDSSRDPNLNPLVVSYRE